MFAKCNPTSARDGTIGQVKAVPRGADKAAQGGGTPNRFGKLRSSPSAAAGPHSATVPPTSTNNSTATRQPPYRVTVPQQQQEQQQNSCAGASPSSVGSCASSSSSSYCTTASSACSSSAPSVPTRASSTSTAATSLHTQRPAANSHMQQQHNKRRSVTSSDTHSHATKSTRADSPDGEEGGEELRRAHTACPFDMNVKVATTTMATASDAAYYGPELLAVDSAGSSPMLPQSSSPSSTPAAAISGEARGGGGGGPRRGGTDFDTTAIAADSHTHHYRRSGPPTAMDVLMTEKAEASTVTGSTAIDPSDAAAMRRRTYADDRPVHSWRGYRHTNANNSRNSNRADPHSSNNGLNASAASANASFGGGGGGDGTGADASATSLSNSLTMKEGHKSLLSSLTLDGPRHVPLVSRIIEKASRSTDEPDDEAYLRQLRDAQSRQNTDEPPYAPVAALVPEAYSMERAREQLMSPRFDNEKYVHIKALDKLAKTASREARRNRGGGDETVAHRLTAVEGGGGAAVDVSSNVLQPPSASASRNVSRCQTRTTTDIALGADSSSARPTRANSSVVRHEDNSEFSPT